MTEKGKGYSVAEKDELKFHGVNPLILKMEAI
jgi:deoxyxylulose-5-phosphate synthase